MPFIDARKLFGKHATSLVDAPDGRKGRDLSVGELMEAFSDWMQNRHGVGPAARGRRRFGKSTVTRIRRYLGTRSGNSSAPAGQDRDKPAPRVALCSARSYKPRPGGAEQTLDGLLQSAAPLGPKRHLTGSTGCAALDPWPRWGRRAGVVYRVLTGDIHVTGERQQPWRK